MMDLIRNFPAISILLCLFAGIISSGFHGKPAKYINLVLILTVTALSACTLGYTLHTGEAFVYVVGKFSAPWGNELRAGVLEAAMALFFCVIMLLSICGGVKKLVGEVAEEKRFLYYVLTDLLLSSLLALVYTNDLFTAYVFVEINTIAACGLIMIRQNGRTVEAAARYMIMSLLGSGLQYPGKRDTDCGKRRLSHSPACDHRVNERGSRHQKRAFSFPYMAAGRLWIFHGFQRGDAFLPGKQGILIFTD